MAISLSNLLARVKHYRKDLHGGEHMYALQTTARTLASLALLDSVTLSVPTVIGQNVYDMVLPAPASELVAQEVARIAAVHRSDGSPLREINAKEFNAIHRYNITDTGAPSRWADRFGVLVLDPTPDAVETLTVEVYVIPAITAESVNLPMQAENAIVAGALFELMAIPGEGYNPQLVSLWASRWTKEMGNYMGSVMLGTSGNGTMHIDSQYQAKTRSGSYGVGGWMQG